MKRLTKEEKEEIASWVKAISKLKLESLARKMEKAFSQFLKWDSEESDLRRIWEHQKQLEKSYIDDAEKRIAYLISEERRSK